MNPRLTVMAGVATVLASTALYPLVWGWHWFWVGAGVVLVVSAVGALTRLRALPAMVCLAAALAGGFLYLNAVFAGPQSWAGLVPTGSSVHHLAVLVSQARTEMSHYAPPVPAARGITLMITAGIGLVAAAADLLAVRLRRPAIAGLPLLVLFCVPLTTDAKPVWVGGTFVFCLGMAGYLALLSADGRDRLRLWGRLVHRWQDEPEGASPDTRPLSAAGRRIGLTAVVLAVFLPLLVPGLKQHRLFSGSGNGTGGRGYHGQISLPDPVAALAGLLHKTHPQTVLTYRTSDSAPPYLQVYVLGRLGSNAWTMAPPKSTSPLHDGNLPGVPGLTRSTLSQPVRENITLSANLVSPKSNLSYLPLPYPARSVKVNGNWQVDPGALTVLQPGAQLAGLKYTVTARDVTPSAAQLRQAPSPPGNLAGYRYVPPSFDRGALARLARRVTQGRSTAYGEAVALQQWFTRPRDFTYSLRAPAARTPGALLKFLTKSKTGYCQQFAFAMAVLARVLGIPSRVVVGYTQGMYTNSGTWQVKTSDAHAWPELYFAGAGWLRFEPTPTGSIGHDGQATASAPTYTVASSLAGNEGPPTLPRTTGPGAAGPTSAPNPGGQISKLTHPQGGGAAGSGRHHGSSALIAIVILAVLAVLLIAPRAARLLRRRWRWWQATDDVKRAHAAWHEIRDDLTDYRFECRASESPRALAARAARALHLTDAQRQALERVARAEERASYAATPAVSGTLARDVAVVRRAIAHASGFTARCRAAILPRSALGPARAALQATLDVFGWLDVVTTRLGRRRPALP